MNEHIKREDVFIKSPMNFRQITSIIIISCINLLFSFKYLNRLENKIVLFAGVVFCTILPILFYLLFSYAKKSQSGLIRKHLFYPYLPWILVSGILLISMAFFFLYPQNLLRVDRFEMINLFWDNWFSNKCPYCPRTEGTNIPGPFPFYFYLAFPFYIINETGYLSLLGVITFVAMLKLSNNKNKISYPLVLILLSCPAVIYEIAGRSTVFLNSVLILIIMLYLNDNKLKTWQNVLITGILTGLLLSTRSLSFLFVFLSYLFFYQKNFFEKKVFLSGVLSLIVFAVTFIPILLVCKDIFPANNPFVVQSSLVPTTYIGIIGIISFFITITLKRFATFCWFSGIICITLFISYLSLFVKNGLINSIIESNVDISYVTFSIPFLLYSMIEAENDNI